MTGGLYNRLTTWGPTDVVTSSALNAEFDNVLNNFIPQMMSGYSANVAQMQIQTSPGNIGTESLPTSLSGELERLRFVIAEITGEPYWYESPVTNLMELNNALGAAVLENKIVSGQTNGTIGSSQPTFLVPSGIANTVTLNAATVPLIYTIQGTNYSISTDVSVTALTVAPTANNTALINDTSISGQLWTQIVGENGSVITLASPGSAITARLGDLCAFKEVATGELMLGRLVSRIINSQTVYQITDARRGYFYNSSSAPIPRSTANNGDTLNLLRLTWIFANTAGGLSIVYDTPTWSGQPPSSPGIGDYWYDFEANYWKIYNGTTFAAANATLIGICVQDGSHTIGARAFDFFEPFSTLNTAELQLDPISSGTVKSRYIGAEVSVYGSLLKVDQNCFYWVAGSDNVSGVTVSAGQFYYFYLDEFGTSHIDSIPPYDVRGTLLGFYHPYQTWRCLGWAYANGTNTFSAIESLHKNDTAAVMQTVTAEQDNDPLPNLTHLTPWVINLDTSGGSYTQYLPPAAQYVGQSITYVKVTQDYNVATLQVAEPPVLVTTGNWSPGTAGNTIVSLGATTGLTSGLIVTGAGIPRGATVSSYAAGTATLTTQVFNTKTTTAVTFGQAGGISGNLNLPIMMPFEFVTLLSIGTAWVVKEHFYPKDPQSYVPSTAGLGTASGAQFVWWREGNFCSVVGSMTAGTTTATPMMLGMPAGLSIDLDVLRNDFLITSVGLGCRINANVNIITGLTPIVITDLSDAANVYLSVTQTGSTPTIAFVKGNGNALLNAGDLFNVQFRVPVKNWIG